jgi:hypothetical protein
MKSTTIIAFDQHAATTMAAVFLSDDRTPALHPSTSETATILRFCGAAATARVRHRLLRSRAVRL